jgi:hypothetical protein
LFTFILARPVARIAKTRPRKPPQVLSIAGLLQGVPAFGMHDPTEKTAGAMVRRFAFG